MVELIWLYNIDDNGYMIELIWLCEFI